MKRIVKFSSVTVAMLITILLFWLYRGIEREFLITSHGYPLTNGYRYLVLGSGHHKLLGGHRPIELGYHLNRLYFDNRYIAGEITEGPDHAEYADYNGEVKRYSYFIFDTETGYYISDLSKSDFKVELEKLNIWEDVKLSSRSDSNWLKKQNPRR